MLQTPFSRPQQVNIRRLKIMINEALKTARRLLEACSFLLSFSLCSGASFAVAAEAEAEEVVVVCGLQRHSSTALATTEAAVAGAAEAVEDGAEAAEEVASADSVAAAVAA